MTAAFQQLQASYEVLMDNEARKKFDVLWLQQKQEKLRSVRERDQWMRMERDWQEEVKREKERWMMRKAPEWKDPVRWGKQQKIGREWYEKVKKEKERQKKLEREWEEDVRREKERQMRMKREAEELRMKMERERQEVEKKDMEAIKKIEEEEKLVYDKLLEEANNEEDVRILEEIWMIRSKILKVIWNKTVFGDFTVRQIKDLFDCFGEVKKVRIKKKRKKGNAFVIMASRESVLAATAAKFANHSESPFIVRPLTLC